MTFPKPFFRVLLPTLCVAFSSYGAEPASARAQAKIESARASDKARSEEAIEDARRLLPGAAGRIPDPADYAAAVRSGAFEKNAGSRAMIAAILTTPLSEKGRPNPDRFRAVRKIVEALTAQPGLPHRALLESVYATAYEKAGDMQQWAEAEELTRLLHPLMFRLGVSAHVEFSRSAAGKRLLRRQKLLIDPIK